MEQHLSVLKSRWEVYRRDVEDEVEKLDEQIKSSLKRGSVRPRPTRGRPAKSGRKEKNRKKDTRAK